MNCITCGGKLRFEENIYVCENCGTKQQPETIFENIDVFICYIETDEQGRRTKDSIMAQEIYNKLQNVGVNVFYQRISISELIDEEFKKVRQIAQSKAKIIILCAASKENFEKIFEKNKECFTDKKIIPVYSSVNAYDMPKELSKLQSINFDNIGSISDLSKNILIMLGRENEIDVAKIINKQTQKRKILNIILICSLFIIVVVGIIFSVIHFSKKNIEETEKEDKVIQYDNLSESEKYYYAEEMMNSGQYLEAAELFEELGNYTNSADMYKKIYDRYDGYYSNDDKLKLSLNVQNNSYVEIEVTSIQDKIIKTSTSSEVINNVISFYYKDSENNIGEGQIELYNDEIKLIMKTENSDDGLTIGNHDVSFALDVKSESPLIEPLTGDTLISWLGKDITKEYIEFKGYELQNIQNPYWQEKIGDVYQIKDTSMEIMLSYIDDDGHGTDYTRVNSFSGCASDICPNLIGKNDDIIIKNEVIYIPFGKVDQYGARRNKDCIIENKDCNNRTITADTIVVVTNKKLAFGGVAVDEVVLEAYKKYGNFENDKVFKYDGGASYCAENNDYHLYYVDITNKNFAAIYKVNKDDFDVEFVCEAPYLYYEDEYRYKILWPQEVLEEFPELLYDN